MILALVGTGYLMRDGHSPIELNYDFDDEGDEVPEAEIISEEYQIPINCKEWFSPDFSV